MTTKRVLFIGAGRMAPPALKILDEAAVSVTLACRDLKKSEALCAILQHAKPISLDVNEANALDMAMSSVNLVISLVPYTYNVAIVQTAIRKKKNVITTSYVSPGLQDLERDIEEAGITVLTECGLDPGIDHCYAMQAIEDIHANGGKVKSFYSNCGGLPAPEFSDNSFGLKLSWSPRGVLLASQSAAKYLANGRVESLSPGRQLMDSARPYFIYPGFSFVSYANRDSSTYGERYDIPEAPNVFRGNLRYPGCVEILKALGTLGFLSTEPAEDSQSQMTWRRFTQSVLGVDGGDKKYLAQVIEELSSFTSDDEKRHVLDAFKWLGLFSDNIATLRSTFIDTVCGVIEDKLAFAPGERDMVMLQHKFEVEKADATIETVTLTLLEYGDPSGDSAMARLVGTACGVGSLLMLNGTISRRGLIAPLTADITKPMIIELEKRGVRFVKKTVAHEW